MPKVAELKNANSPIGKTTQQGSKVYVKFVFSSNHENLTAYWSKSKFKGSTGSYLFNV